uniref:Uncharacterized protein n=1 Tax=Setaria italica TaxID=4555 RepID=K4AIZ1_SETIT
MRRQGRDAAGGAARVEGHVPSALGGVHQRCHEDHPPSKPRDMPSLAYLGKGRICICRPMSTMDPNDYGPPITYDAASFLVVELKSLPNGDLHLARRGKMTSRRPPQGRQSPANARWTDGWLARKLLQRCELPDPPLAPYRQGGNPSTAAAAVLLACCSIGQAFRWRPA